MWTIYFLIFVGLVLGAAAYLLFVWSVKKDQYDDVEGPKYRILNDDDENTTKEEKK